jgi:hypothetical protein
MRLFIYIIRAITTAITGPEVLPRWANQQEPLREVIVRP